ncbi:MAG: Rne/Rng family ribonuclease, partial [Pseudomonadota bacterium]
MTKRILVDAAHPEETRIVTLEDNKIIEFDYEASSKKQIKGNVYLAKVTRVEPSLQAAFVDYGEDKHGFLPFSEIHPDYFQLPLDVKRKLLDSLRLSNKENDEDFDGNNQDDIDASKLNDENLGDVDSKLDADSDNNIKDDESIEQDQLPKDYSNPIDSSEIDNEDSESYSEYDNPLDGDQKAAINVDDANEEEEYIEKLEVINMLNVHKSYRINEVIKRGQLIQVQVIKEERGNKGASLTSYISLAGRYCVYIPRSSGQGGISRRITNIEDRRRLKSYIKSFEIDDQASIIIRTAGLNKTKEELLQDYTYLKTLWNNIREKTLSATAPAYIHTEGDIITRFVKDFLNSSVSEILVDGDKAYKITKTFVQLLMPHFVKKVKKYRFKIPIFTKYGVEDKILQLYNSTSYMPSGGYIVINPTEAMISIDVNSGRATSGKNVEDTALSTNIEAAQEIAIQLKLRDLSGLVVIDFIDMYSIKNRKIVERSLRDSFKSDKAKIQIGRISNFGLLEMSRQRLKSNFWESNTIQCDHCNGMGVVRSPESNSVLILRAIEQYLRSHHHKKLNIYSSMKVMSYLLNNKRQEIQAIEDNHNVNLFFHFDPNIEGDNFKIFKAKNTDFSVQDKLPAVNLLDAYIPDDEDENNIIEEDITIKAEDHKNSKNGKGNNNRKNVNKKRTNNSNKNSKKHDQNSRKMVAKNTNKKTSESSGNGRDYTKEDGNNKAN